MEYILLILSLQMILPILRYPSNFCRHKCCWIFKPFKTSNA